MAPSSVFKAAASASTSAPALNGGAGDKRKRPAKEVQPEVEEDEEEDEEDEQDEEGDEDSLEDDDEEEEDSEDDEEEEEEEEEDLAEIAASNGKGKGKGRLQEDDANAGTEKIFKQKTLILSSRGITHRMRHMMKDLSSLLPHSKTDAKLDTKHQLSLLNELADLSNCSSALFFEARRHADLYMWTSLTPNGPSVRFHLLNAHTMDELKMTGNCLKGSRPIVVFDSAFDETAHFRLIKEVLMQIFAVPKTARRAKPFVDHVTSFSLTDGKVWFRNYQLVHDSPLDVTKTGDDDTPEEIARKALKLSKNVEDNMSLNEIGPRFVLTPVKIFEGSFGGAVVWQNEDFLTPQAKQQNMKVAKAAEYRARKGQESETKGRREVLNAKEMQERETSGRAALDKRKVFA